MGNNDDERIEAYINQIKNDKVLLKQIESKKSGGLKEFIEGVIPTIVTIASAVKVVGEIILKLFT